MSVYDWVAKLFRKSPAVQDFGKITPQDPGNIRYVFVPLKHAGIYVDHDTALRFSAVFRSIAYISQTIAGLPWEVYRETGDKTTKLPAHPVWNLIKTRPNSEMSAFSWRETMVAWALSWGNGYSEIVRNPYTGQPVELWPIPPDRVTPRRDPQTKEFFYEVQQDFGDRVIIPKEDMFHLHGLGFDGLVGYSVISLAARSIGLSIAAESYGEDFFANGAVSTGIVTHPGRLSPEAYDRLKADVDSKTKGGSRRWSPLIFEEGMGWQSLSIPPEDAQMLQTRQFQVSDIARWFGLPPHKLADLSRATFSNIEHQSIEVVNDAFMPWVNRLESEASLKLFSGRERGVRTKINVRGLLRGDDRSRAEYYKMMREMGVYSTNDIRRLEDMDPVGPEGDALIVQLNQTTLDRIVSGEALNSNKQTESGSKKEAVKQMASSTFSRIYSREMNHFQRMKAENKDEWWNRFQSSHHDYIRNNLEPVFTLAATLMGSSVGKSSSEYFISSLMDECRGRINEESYSVDISELAKITANKFLNFVTEGV